MSLQDESSGDSTVCWSPLRRREWPGKRPGKAVLLLVDVKQADSIVRSFLLGKETAIEIGRRYGIHEKVVTGLVCFLSGYSAPRGGRACMSERKRCLSEWRRLRPHYDELRWQMTEDLGRNVVVPGGLLAKMRRLIEAAPAGKDPSADKVGVLQAMDALLRSELKPRKKTPTSKEVA